MLAYEEMSLNYSCLFRPGNHSVTSVSTAATGSRVQGADSVPLTPRRNSRRQTRNATNASDGDEEGVPNLADVDQEEVTGIRLAGLPRRRLRKLDKHADVIPVAFSAEEGPPVFTIPNFKQGKRGKRYLPAVTMLVSILSQLQLLREHCFSPKKWKVQASMTGDAEPHLCEEQLLDLVKKITKSKAFSSIRQNSSRHGDVAGNIETIVTGRGDEADEEEVASLAANWLKSKCQNLDVLETFEASSWDQVDDKCLYVLVPDPADSPTDPHKIHKPFGNWRLVFAAKSGGTAHCRSQTAPPMAFSNGGRGIPESLVEKGMHHDFL